jgi:phenylpropionate dioxygenase-like ring-hydroxylating dioxygenase large terminal subunit
MSAVSIAASTKHDIAAPAFYADAVRPAGEARVLPPAAFRSLAFAQAEDLAIWTRDWICVGTHQDIPAEGDLLPFTIGTHGLHVQRVETGLAARFNKAQHGGCRLVPVQCQTGTKTRCSFTSCGHSRDRDAIPAGAIGEGTPEMHQYLGLRPERLLTAGVRSWGPLIFVGLDDAGPGLAAAVTGLGRATPFFDNARGTRIGDQWVERRANWKLLAQHLLGDVVVMTGMDAAWISGQATLPDQSTLQVAWLFPNLVLLTDAVETCAIVLQPTAIAQTMIRLSVFGSSGAEPGAVKRWRDRLERMLDQAEAAQDAAQKWGTVSRPETIGAALPLQFHVQGLWMQRQVSRRMLGLSTLAIDLQRYQLSRPS